MTILRVWLVCLGAAVCANGAETACSLVTAAEATAALGAPVAAGVSTFARFGSSCRYGAAWPWEPGNRASPDFPRATLFITLTETHARENFDFWKNGALQTPGATAMDLEGLGDRAALVSLSDSSVILLVLHHDRLIEFVLTGLPCDDSRRILSDLAHRILA